MSVIDDDGFTIVETLVALTVLAVMSIMFARSISAASTQLAAADRLVDAVSLGKEKMAHTEVRFTDDLEGIDEATGLIWKRTMEAVSPGSSGANGALVIVSIEVSQTRSGPAILKLHTVRKVAD